jgi:hypothetical protein
LWRQRAGCCCCCCQPRIQAGNPCGSSLFVPSAQLLPNNLLHITCSFSTPRPPIHRTILNLCSPHYTTLHISAFGCLSQDSGLSKDVLPFWNDLDMPRIFCDTKLWPRSVVLCCRIRLLSKLRLKIHVCQALLLNAQHDRHQYHRLI